MPPATIRSKQRPTGVGHNFQRIEIKRAITGIGRYVDGRDTGVIFTKSCKKVIVCAAFQKIVCKYVVCRVVRFTAKNSQYQLVLGTLISDIGSAGGLACNASNISY